jgi:hypothetical protein
MSHCPVWFSKTGQATSTVGSSPSQTTKLKWLAATIAARAWFSFKIFRKKTVDFLSHRIFEHMHEALNIYKK